MSEKREDVDGGGDEGEESSSPALFFFFFCAAGLLLSAHKFQNNRVYSCLLVYICLAVGPNESEIKSVLLPG